MADIKKTVEVLFKGTDSLSGTVGTMASNVGSATEPLANLAGSLAKANLALAGIATGLAGLSLVKAGQFETAFDKTAAIIDTSDENLSGFRGSLLDYSRDSSKSLGDITDATFNAVSAGTDYTKVLGSLTAAEKLAVVGQTGLDDSLSLISKTINAYGLEASDAEGLAEIFFETNKQGITTIGEMSQSLAGVTGVAATAGVPITEVAAALATLTASGVPTTAAVTQIKAILSNIVKPSTQAAEAAKELGIEFNTTALRGKGFQDFLLDVFDKTGGNVDSLGQLFGSVEALGGASVLGANANGKYVETLDAITDASGNMIDPLEKVSDSFELTNQRLVNNIDATLIQIGDKMLGGYGDIAEGVIKVLKGIGEEIESGSLGGLFDFLEGKFEGVGEILSGVAELLPEALNGVDFTPLMEAIEDSSDGILALFDIGEDDLTSEGLQQLIQNIVDAIGGVITVGAGLLEGFSPMVVAFGKLVVAASKADPEIIKAVGIALGGAFAINKTAGIITGLAGFVSGMTGLGTAVTNMDGAKIGKLLPLLKSLGTVGAVGAAGAVGFGIGTLINGAIDDITKSVTKEGYDTFGAWLFDQMNPPEKPLSIDTQKLIADALEIKKIVEGIDELFEKKAEGGGAVSDADILAEFTKAGLVNSAGGFLDKVQEDIDKLSESAQGFIDDNGTFVVTSLGKIKEAAGTASKQITIVKEETDEFRLKLEAISSNERIKSFEIAADVKIVELEKDAERAIKAFDSIDSSIGATSTLLGGLFDALGNSDLSRLDKLNIQSNIDEQVKLQKESLELQRRVIEAELERLRIQNKALQEGGGFINITLEGVEPELEMIMFKIIERVQARVNEQGLPALLGI